METPQSWLCSPPNTCAYYARSEVDLTELADIPETKPSLEIPSRFAKDGPIMSQTTRRCSTTSSSHTSSRQSDQLLLEMLQDIRSELTAQRALMLDIQRRVSHLEKDSGNNNVESNHIKAPLPVKHTDTQKIRDYPSPQIRPLIPRKSKARQPTYHSFEKNSEPLFKRNHIPKTPARLSGIDWKKAVVSPSMAVHIQSPPITPPAATDVPALMCDYPEEESSDVDTCNSSDMDDAATLCKSMELSPQVVDYGDDVKEHVIEIDKRRFPAPPMIGAVPAGKRLKTPPRDSPILTGCSDGVESSCQSKAEPHRFYKGVKSLITYKTLLKSKRVDRGERCLLEP